jgi:hypothetical protein
VRLLDFFKWCSDCFRKHVFEDLKPYVCTIDGCEEPRTLFNHSLMWAEHETSHLMSNTAECPFCAASFQQRALTYFKHVSTHLQEVSLSVLPHPADEDDGFDSEDSNAEEDNSSIFGPNLGEGIEYDSSLGQKESSSQLEPVQIFSEPADVAGPSDQGHNQTTSASTQAALKNQEEIYLIGIIDRLLEVRGSRPGRQVQLLESDIRYLCTKAREIFVSQPMLLELEAPLKVKHDNFSVLHILRAYITRFVVISTASIMIF